VVRKLTKMASQLTKVEIREVLEMNTEELKRLMSQFGFEGKSMQKTAMQDLLIKEILKQAPEPDVKGGEFATAEAGMGIVIPPFIAKLAPELQLQWFLEDSKIKALKEAEEVKANHLLAMKQVDLESQKLKAAELEKQRQAEFEKLKLEAEMKAAELDMQRRAEIEKQRLAAEAELELEKLKLEAASAVSAVTAAPSAESAIILSFRLDQAVKLLPRFNEKNVEEYLISFEKIAEINNWPTDRYASILQAVLVGKGLKVVSELSTEDCKDYSKLKEALLQAYSVVSEVHRHRFRTCVKQTSDTFADFAFILWCTFQTLVGRRRGV
jgi:hypothetical protein